jgi:hypothetical protein
MIEWRTVDEFPAYEVSEVGDVRLIGGNVLKAPADQQGYARVTFSVPGKKTYRNVHRLVAIAFYGPVPNDRPMVCHVNGNRLDNRVSNLRFGTAKENRMDAIRHGTASNSGPRFTKAVRSLIREAAKELPTSDLARKFGISKDYARRLRSLVAA